MRLASEQITAIKNAVRKRCGEAARIWLFGSRADDAARGGDIDLLVEIKEAIPNRDQRESQIIVDIWKAIGEQKIGLILIDQTSAPQPIHAIARETGVLL
jgi:predicted nucleotidyltransferase